MVKGSSEHAEAEICLYRVYPRSKIESALLKALYDARIAPPTVASVEELKEALESLIDEYAFALIRTFSDNPCLDISTRNVNEIETIFQNLLKDNTEDLRYWAVVNIYSKPIPDERAYYDHGVSAVILQQYENNRADADMPPLTQDERVETLYYINRMVTALADEFAESQFTPPTMPAASHPAVAQYLRNLATFPQYRETEFLSSKSSKPVYVKLFLPILQAREEAVRKAKRKRTLMIGALVVSAGVGVALLIRKLPKSAPQPSRRVIISPPFTPEQQLYAQRKYARDDYPRLVVAKD